MSLPRKVYSALRRWRDAGGPPITYRPDVRRYQVGSRLLTRTEVGERIKQWREAAQREE